MKDFISIADCTKEELREFLDVAKRLKKQYKATGRNDPLLAGKMLAMIFEKPSLRTRVSFAVAMQHLGGANRDPIAHDGEDAGDVFDGFTLAEADFFLSQH